ncbi:hypothetical protein [Bradyrhizobium sp. 173]|uniref:hypothetical protein n=1 Tax=Bradyrhizobium sp. 173 TaxID=2782644 RepID=UPI001FF89FAE|nr:hypothetical protein [Bradyrhizobium sp. 173]
MLGHIYGISRAQLGVRREKKGKANWPSTFPLTMADAAGESAVQVVTEEHPALLRMINWPPAGALAGAELDDSGIKGAMMSGSSIKPGLVRKTAKVHRGKRVFLTTKTKVTVDDFARFLAKIGHSFAVAERGLGTFTPCLINAVLNEPPTHLASLVGGSIVPTPAAPDLHEIELREEITRRHTLLVVRIQLFADIGIVDPNGAITPMPSYDVVAGLAPRS